MLARVAIVLALFGCKQKSEPPAATPAPAAQVDPWAEKRDAGVSGLAAALAKAHTLDETLEALRADTHVPALAAAVWRDGKLVDIGAVGLRKVDDPASKVTTKDLWHLGSNTKAMTATLIGIYVDRGVLHWDDTLATLFKGTKIDPGYAKVTLDQLLRHEGGAPGTQPRDLWKQLWADADKPDARATYVHAVLARPPAQAPGTFVYSNTGYMIAGAALEKVTGKPWQQLMRDELFAKLDMKTCGFGPPGRKDVVDEPWGHDAGGTPIAPGPAADNPPGIGPAGTVHCSLEDYGKFLALHATGQPAIVKPETLQHLHTTQGRYAGGWIVFDTPRGKALAHSGSNTMWFLTAMVTVTEKPEERWTVVVATNQGTDIESALEPIARRYFAAKK